MLMAWIWTASRIRVDRQSVRGVSLADAATLDSADNSGKSPEGELAPTAVDNNDDAHDKTKDRTTPPPLHAPKVRIEEPD